MQILAKRTFLGGIAFLTINAILVLPAPLTDVEIALLDGAVYELRESALLPPEIYRIEKQKRCHNMEGSGE